jgi:glycogen(starch) synthase
VMVHTCEPTSGAARYVSEFVAGLAANSADVTLFCPPTFDCVSRLRALGVRVVFSAHRSTMPAGPFVLVIRNLRYALLTALRQVLASSPGEIVHFQFPLYFPVGLVFFALARCRKCPVFFTVHDPLPHKWLLPDRFRRFEWNMLRMAYRLSDTLIVHNQNGKDVLVGEFGQRADKITVIPHGSLRLGARVDPAPARGLRLLLFGAIRENKGVHLAIRAVQSLNALSHSVDLTIAGTPANVREIRYWRECRQLIDQAPCGIRVVDRYIENNEIGPLINEHHALLLPYLHYASESGVAALALSNGRPIIATNAGGAGSMLAEAACGIPIDAETTEAVASAIRQAIKAGPEMLHRMGQTGAEFMNAARSWEDIGRQTLAAYARLRAA